MKKLVPILLTMTMMMTLFTGMAFADPGNGMDKDKEFKDIKGHWGMSTIMKMQKLGILQGYEDDTFRPENTLTQAELAVIIDRLIDKLNVTDDDDDDAITDDDDAITNDDDDDEDDDELQGVPEWANKSVKKGLEQGYLNMKRFHSNVQVDRLQACVTIAKALEEADLLEVKSSYEINPFKDKGLFENEDDYRYILALYEAGFIKGNPDGNFNPNALLNRAHMASIIDNLFDDDDDVVSDDNIKPQWDDDSDVTATVITADSVTLKWTEADDNEGVTGYKVLYTLGDDDKVKLVGNVKTVKITGLEADEEYEFTVEARDAAGNWSEDGPSVEVTTLEEDAVDTERPTWPSGSVIDDNEITTDSIDLEWTEADDDVAVTGYEVKVFEDGYLLVDTLDTEDNDIAVDDLDDDTEYTFQIRAYDAAGNKSIKLTGVFSTDEI